MESALLLASLRPLAAAVDRAIIIVDPAGRVLEWNPAAERLYGMARAEILGREVTRFFAPSTLLVRQVLQTGQAVESTYHQPRSGLHVLATATPVYDGGKLVGAVSVERDVTDVVELSAELMAARDQVSVLKRQLQEKPAVSLPESDPFQAVRGQHPLLQQAIELARRVAPTEAVTLIRGESGVGKELFAQGIHKASRRAGGPFVALNCGAIPPALFESELFGYAPGAFTGANPKGQPGKLELANGGTIFLDEVGDLPAEAQVKLLRFLEDRRFYPVGGLIPITVDVRILAATNRPLEELVRQGRFRDDLYWRLNVVSLDLPPLRERKDDIVDLVQMFIHEFNLRHGRSVSRVHPTVTHALLEHPWPGNVRELRNTVERLVVLARGDIVEPEELPVALRPPVAPTAAPAPDPEPAPAPPPGRGLTGAVRQTERDEIFAALAAAGQNRSEAARLLGISRATLYYKCRRLNITWKKAESPAASAVSTKLGEEPFA